MMSGIMQLRIILVNQAFQTDLCTDKRVTLKQPGN